MSQLTHVRHKRLRQHRVESPQHSIMPNNQVRLRSQRVEHSSQLHTDVPSTDHGHSLGLGLDIKEPIRIDTVRSSRDLVIAWDSGSSANGYTDLLGFDLVFAPICLLDLDGVGVDKGGPAFVVVDVLLLQVPVAIASALLHRSEIKPLRHDEDGR